MTSDDQAFQYLALSTGQRVIDLEMQLAKVKAERDRVVQELEVLRTPSPPAT